MTRPNRAPAAHDSADAASNVPPASALWMPFEEMQRLQWHSLLAWQQSLVVYQKDLWEQWACRYGGGVPIDG